MINDGLLDIARDALNDAELDSKEIPNIDLYVDQIINLISDKLKEGSSRYNERVLTKTMINNYSKDGIITPVKGKKYNKEQILQMLTVYSLKSTLSIGEIKRLLDGAYATENFNCDSLISMYDKHIEIKEQSREYAKEALADIIENNQLDISDDCDYISTVFALAVYSAQLGNIAQAMIDALFPEPVDTEDDKQEKEAEKEAEKEKAKKEKAAEKAKKKEAKKKKAENSEAEVIETNA